MSNKDTLRNWGIIIAVLVVTSALTVLWPTMFGGGSAGVATSSLPVETEQVELRTIPGIGGMLADQLGTESLSGFVLMGVMAAIVIGAVVVPGVGLAFVYTFLSNFVQREKESDDYKSREQTLEKNVATQIKEMREGRKASGMPSHERPGWSAWATSLIITMFGIFFGLMVVRTFYPNNELILENSPLQNLFGTIVNVSTLTTWLVILVLALYLGFRMRPRRIQAADQDVPAIPWDMIVVILTGLLVVGLGIGFAVYLNVPV